MKTSKPAKKEMLINERPTTPHVIGEVNIYRDAMHLLNEISSDLRHNVELETLIQTVFNYGLNTVRREREQEGDAALSYFMENAPVRRGSALRAFRIPAA